MVSINKTKDTLLYSSRAHPVAAPTLVQSVPDVPCKTNVVCSILIKKFSQVFLLFWRTFYPYKTTAGCPLLWIAITSTMNLN